MHAVDGPDGALHVADEVGVSGGVEDVDLDAVPLDRGHRERDADAPADLLGIVVGDGVAVLDPAHSGERPGREQHGLEERGLAGAAVADQQHVADVAGLVDVHPVLSLPAWNGDSSRRVLPGQPATSSLVGSGNRPMANPPHPARREPGALWLLGLSILCAAGAATLLLTGHPAAGGAAGLAASVACFGGDQRHRRAGVVRPRARLDRSSTPPSSPPSRGPPEPPTPRSPRSRSCTLGAALVGSYERARAAALGYRTRRTAWLALVRRALPASGLIVGGTWLTASLWAALGLAVFTLAVRAMGVVLQERGGRAQQAAGVTTGGAP